MSDFQQQVSWNPFFTHRAVRKSSFCHYCPLSFKWCTHIEDFVGVEGRNLSGIAQCIGPIEDVNNLISCLPILNSKYMVQYSFISDSFNVSCCNGWQVLWNPLLMPGLSPTHTLHHSIQSGSYHVILHSVYF